MTVYYEIVFWAARVVIAFLSFLLVWAIVEIIRELRDERRSALLVERRVGPFDRRRRLPIH